MESYFPALLITYLTQFRQAFYTSSYRYFCGYVLALLLSTGRKTTSTIAKFSFWIDRSASSWERFLSTAIWDSEILIEKLIALTIARCGDRLLIAAHYIIPLDSTIVEKVAVKMNGIQKWSEKDKSRIGHHWLLGGLLCQLGHRFVALPLVSRLIYGRLTNDAFCVNKFGGVTPLGFFEVALAVVFSITTHLNLAPPLVVADAYFAKATFINPLIDAGIGIVTRLRHDAVGFWAPKYTGRGRPPVRGKRCKLSHWLNLFDSQQTTVTIYNKTVSLRFVAQQIHLRGVEKPVTVVVIATAHRPVILMSTCHSLTPEQIIEIYAARFAIELTIRNLKQHLGLGHYQAQTTLAILRAVQLACCAATLGQLWLIETQPAEIASVQSFLSLRRQLRRYVIEQVIFHKFASDADFQQCQVDIEPIIRLAG